MSDMIGFDSFEIFSLNTFFLQIKMPDLIKYISSKWKTYKFRFVPWIIFNVRNNPSHQLQADSKKVLTSLVLL